MSEHGKHNQKTCNSVFGLRGSEIETNAVLDQSYSPSKMKIGSSEKSHFMHDMWHNDEVRMRSLTGREETMWRENFKTKHEGTAGSRLIISQNQQTWDVNAGEWALYPTLLMQGSTGYQRLHHSKTLSWCHRRNSDHITRWLGRLGSGNQNNDGSQLNTVHLHILHFSAILSFEENRLLHNAAVDDVSNCVNFNRVPTISHTPRKKFALADWRTRVPTVWKISCTKIFYETDELWKIIHIQFHNTIFENEQFSIENKI